MATSRTDFCAIPRACELLQHSIDTFTSLFRPPELQLTARAAFASDVTRLFKGIPKLIRKPNMYLPHEANATAAIASDKKVPLPRERLPLDLGCRAEPVPIQPHYSCIRIRMRVRKQTLREILWIHGCIGDSERLSDVIWYTHLHAYGIVPAATGSLSSQQICAHIARPGASCQQQLPTRSIGAFPPGKLAFPSVFHLATLPRYSTEGYPSEGYTEPKGSSRVSQWSFIRLLA